MPTSNTGNPLKNWTTIWHNGTLTSKNTTSSSNISWERSTHWLMNYHTHQIPIKVKMTTKTKHSLNQSFLSIPPTYRRFPNHQKEIWWLWSMTTPQLDTQDVMKQLEKLWKYYCGLECANRYWITSKDVQSVSKIKSSLIDQRYPSIGSQQKKEPFPFNKLQWILLQDFCSITDTMPS